MGWSVNNSNYFNQADFDPGDDGWPRNLNSIDDYRNSGGAQLPSSRPGRLAGRGGFRLSAQVGQRLAKFCRLRAASVKLPIIDVDSQLKELAPGKVDFDFAQDISLQLPRIKELDFVNDALNGNIGPLLSVSNAIRGTLTKRWT